MIADFEEYTRLYRESWGQPTIRWLLSTVPTAMIFDDHDVIDDWNTSKDWVDEIRGQGWWDRRIVGGFMSYLVYQHWGNLPPDALAEDEMFALVTDEPGIDITEPLQEFAYRADREVQGTRWSYYRDIGPARLVMMDSRAGRVLQPGVRSMIDPSEMRWIEQHATGDFDHLLLGTSLPLFLTPALHDLEAWNEAVCAGAWGRAGLRFGEKVRRGIDLEHWASFHTSFERLAGLIREVAMGRRGAAPATIVLLSGDVHYAYLAEMTFPGATVESRVYQAVCSPFRHSLEPKLERANRFACGRAGALVGAILMRTASVPRPSVSWEISHGPYFENEVATLALEGRAATVALERTPPSELRLEGVLEHRLT
jgi:hypothetical protein